MVSTFGAESLSPDSPKPKCLFLINCRLLPTALAYHSDLSELRFIDGSDCDSVERLISEIDKHQPEIILLDADTRVSLLPELGKLRREQASKARLAVIFSNKSMNVLELALGNGADGFFDKLDSIDSVVEGLLKLLDSEQVVSSGLQDRFHYDRRTGKYDLKREPRGSQLTVRQAEVLGHLAKGSSVKETAKRMNLSEKAIDSHKYRIMSRLGLHNRVELALYAIREGLISLDEAETQLTKSAKEVIQD